MIRAWLLKHRWVNETGKTIVGILFAYFAYLSFEAGKEMYFGIIAGVMGTFSVFILTDVIYSIFGIQKKKKQKERKGREGKGIEENRIEENGIEESY